jgi:carbamoyltransferase
MGALSVPLKKNDLPGLNIGPVSPNCLLKACLSDAGITINDLDGIAIGRDPKAHQMKKLKRVLSGKANIPWLLERFKNSMKVGSIEDDFRKYFPQAKSALRRYYI